MIGVGRGCGLRVWCQMLFYILLMASKQIDKICTFKPVQLFQERLNLTNCYGEKQNKTILDFQLQFTIFRSISKKKLSQIIGKYSTPQVVESGLNWPKSLPRYLQYHFQLTKQMSTTSEKNSQ